MQTNLCNLLNYLNFFKLSKQLIPSLFLLMDVIIFFENLYFRNLLFTGDFYSEKRFKSFRRRRSKYFSCLGRFWPKLGTVARSSSNLTDKNSN